MGVSNVTTPNYLSISSATATNWTTQQKAYYAQLQQIGVNILSEVARQFGVTLQYKWGGWYFSDVTEGQNWSMSDMNNVLNNLKDYLETKKNTSLDKFLIDAMKFNGLQVASPTTNTSSNVDVLASAVVTPKASQSELQQKLIAISKTYNRLDQFHLSFQAQNFFQNPNYLGAMQDAVTLLGMPPYGNDGGNNWNAGYLDFYITAKYLVDYPLPTNANMDCYKCGTALLSFESALTDVNQQKLNGVDSNEIAADIKAIGLLKRKYDSWYNQNSCDLKIQTDQANQAKQNELELQQKSTADIAAQLNAAVGDGTQGGNKTTMYIIYGVGAVILTLGAILLLKPSNN